MLNIYHVFHLIKDTIKYNMHFIFAKKKTIANYDVMFNYPEFYFVLILIALVIKSSSKFKKR